MMRSTKTIDVLSLARYDAVVTGVIGIIVGVLYAAMQISKGIAAGEAWTGIWVGFLVLVLTPLGYALIGFILGAVCSLAYNFFSMQSSGYKKPERYD